MEPKTISVIIPCHNEEAAIGRVIGAIPKGVVEVIVVDNASTDRTAEIARSAGAVVISENKLGYGAALKTGFAAAKGNILATLDGDLQHPPDKILEMAAYLDKNGLDFLVASRFPLRRGETRTFRMFGCWFLTLAGNILFGLKLKDILSGMWVFRKSVLREITLKSDDFMLSEEIKIKVATNPKLKFAEYNVPFCSRIGQSKLRPLKDGVLYLAGLLKLKIGLE